MLGMALFALMLPAQANTTADLGYYTAADLRDRCTPGPKTNPTYCFSYLTGVHDAMRAYELWLNMREFCIPAQTPQAELRGAFLEYLNANPQEESAQAASVVAIALKQRFACASAAAPVAPRQGE